MIVFTQKRANYMLSELWKLPFNPIYFFLKHFFLYTSIFTFASTIAFWHAYPFVSVVSPYIFYSGNDICVMTDGDACLVDIEYLLILVLTTTSFFFSVDLYTAMSAKSYMFREHYHYDCFTNYGPPRNNGLLIYFKEGILNS
ncbi:hypothetical protein L3Y34_002255 [Caenorhabditis briggsae]|uniref:Uncharacterized protein n=1 Tax=Caenorhabditis briggsae TaxID=6238 RepID=A0AAE9ISD7_CAEBR|nr:hypothetical protein L3Y34_002255 [Caenorhabditis briggsae]